MKQNRKKKIIKINDINEHMSFRDSWDSEKHQTFKP